MNFVIFKESTAREIESTLARLHTHLVHHPSKKIDTQKLVELMEQVRKSCEKIEEFKKESCWTHSRAKWTFRVITVTSIAALCFSLGTDIYTYYNDDSGDPGLFSISIIAPVLGTVGGLCGSIYEKKSNDRQEILDELESHKQTTTFEELLKAIQELNKQGSDQNFKTCVAKMKELEDAHDTTYLPRLGSKEELVSNLIQQTEKNHPVRKKIRKFMQRGRNYEGERADSPDPMTFKSIVQEIGLDVAWVSYHGKTLKDEPLRREAYSAPSTPVIIDIDEPPLEEAL